MDPLDKLEFILESMIKNKRRELKLGEEEGVHPASVYLYGIRSQINAFEDSLNLVRAIKLNPSSMSDEVVLKMYGEREK